MMAVTQILLIGEAPGKQSTSPGFDGALMGRIGKRLAGLMGTTLNVYRWNTTRCNLLKKNGKPWLPKRARRAARRMENLGLYARKGRVVILLGRNVARAFGFGSAPWFKAFWNGNVVVVVAPHPSGKSRWWNDPANTEEARKFWQTVKRRMML